MFRLLFELLLYSGAYIAVLGQQGDPCTLASRKTGQCTAIERCPSAVELVRQNKRPQLCGFHGKDPLVCCKTNEIIGTVSSQKCKEYHGVGGVNTRGGIGIPKRLFVIGGTRSLAKEYPHMAIIGYGDKNSIQWQCGGSLISESHVVTAAHCATSRELGNAKWVRLGDLNISSTTDDAAPQDFYVKSATIHPNYKPPSKYNDIALLRLDRKASFTSYVKPACLYLETTVGASLSATGWGLSEFAGTPSSHLMTVDLKEVPNDVCRKFYSKESSKTLARGILDDIQICAGGMVGKDTCQGDSGGPLQIKNEKLNAYHIVGITSFGKACGLTATPGVYTRLSAYVGWIEKNVWRPPGRT